MIWPVPDWVRVCTVLLKLVMSMAVPVLSPPENDASVPSTISPSVDNSVVVPVQKIEVPVSLQAAWAWLAVSPVRAAPPKPAPRTIAAAPASAEGDARPTEGA